MINMKWFAVIPSLCLQLYIAPAIAADNVMKGPLKSEPVGTGDFFQMLFGLLIVLAIIIGMAWFIRRMGSFQQVSNGSLRILGGLSLGQRERVVLVQVGEKQLLIGLAPGQIRTLHVPEKSVAAGKIKQEQSSSFSEKLQSVMQGKLRQ